MPAPAERFEIRYANGKIQFATSLPEAERKVAHETADGRIRGLLPATITSCDSDVIGRGEPVKTITGEDAETLRSSAAVLRTTAARY